jgi:hypothetical protein
MGLHHPFPQQQRRLHRLPNPQGGERVGHYQMIRRHPVYEQGKSGGARMYTYIVIYVEQGAPSVPTAGLTKLCAPEKVVLPTFSGSNTSYSSSAKESTSRTVQKPHAKPCIDTSQRPPPHSAGSSIWNALWSPQKEYFEEADVPNPKVDLDNHPPPSSSSSELEG